MRTRVATVLAMVVLLAAAPAIARAQANTAETLADAMRLYEDLQVERAVVLLRQVISPSSPYEVSREQRVQAYKYLGAALAVLGKSDSAVVYLRAALERDPFTDMDAQSFSPAERAALAEARTRTFAVAVRPVEDNAIDPRTERLSFAVLTTHGAALRVDVRGAGRGTTELETATLLDGESEGLREIPWNGVLSDGRLAPAGRYALVVTGRSRLTGRADSTRIWFDLRHERQALEDTLPPLTAAELLPERNSASVAGRDLLRGVAVAAGALLAHSAIADRHLGGGGRYAAAVAGAGLVAGTGAFVFRLRHRDIPENVVENARRVDERMRHNAGVRARNAERLAQTRLIVAPAAGAAP